MMTGGTAGMMTGGTAGAGEGGAAGMMTGGTAGMMTGGTAGMMTGGTGGGSANNGDTAYFNFESGTQGWAPVRGPEDAVVRTSTERVFMEGQGLQSLEYVVPAVTQEEIDAAMPDMMNVRSVERGVGLNVPNIPYQPGTTRPLFAGRTVTLRLWVPEGYNATYTTVFALAPDPIVPGWWANAEFIAVVPGQWNTFTFAVPAAGANIGQGQFYTFGVYMKFEQPWAGGSVFVDSVDF